MICYVYYWIISTSFPRFMFEGSSVKELFFIVRLFRFDNDASGEKSVILLSVKSKVSSVVILQNALTSFINLPFMKKV